MSKGTQANLPRGEREWGDWLDKLNRNKKQQVVERLAKEFAQTIAGGQRLSAVRMMEAAVAPANPPFGKLGATEARDLRGRLVKAWGKARLTNGDAGAQERFDALLRLLDHWPQYRKARKRSAEAAAAASAATAPRRAKPSDEELEEFYQRWVRRPFRENLQRVLKARSESRRELSFRVDMTEAYLSLVLSGARYPSLKKMASISMALGIPLDNLLTVSKYDLESDDGRKAFAAAQPGDNRRFVPGQITTPMDALEKHFKVVFYPGPDLPGEKIPARSHLIIDPNVTGFNESEKYALRDEDGLILICSFLASQDQEAVFASFEGRSIRARYGEAAQAPLVIGKVMGVLLS